MTDTTQAAGLTDLPERLEAEIVRTVSLDLLHQEAANEIRRLRAALAAQALPAGLAECLDRIDSYAKGIKSRLDSKDYFGEDAPIGLKNGPIYSAAERADFIVNCVRDMRKMLAASPAPAEAKEEPGNQLWACLTNAAGELQFKTEADARDCQRDMGGKVYQVAAGESAPQPQAAQAVPAGWRSEAANWLRAKAEQQRKTNTEYPQHVACYPSWEKRVRDLEWLASELDASPTPAEAKEEPKRRPQIADSGCVLGEPHADWPEWCQTFNERLAYQCGVADARALQPQAAQPVAIYEGRRLSPEGTREIWGYLTSEHEPPVGAKLYTYAPALTEDKARLDYLQSARATIDFAGPMLKFRIGGRGEAVSRDVREAIDKARALRSTQGGE